MIDLTTVVNVSPSIHAYHVEKAAKTPTRAFRCISIMPLINHALVFVGSGIALANLVSPVSMSLHRVAYIRYVGGQKMEITGRTICAGRGEPLARTDSAFTWRAHIAESSSCVSLEATRRTLLAALKYFKVEEPRGTLRANLSAPQGLCSRAPACRAVFAEILFFSLLKFPRGAKLAISGAPRPVIEAAWNAVFTVIFGFAFGGCPSTFAVVASFTAPFIPLILVEAGGARSTASTATCLVRPFFAFGIA